LKFTRPTGKNPNNIQFFFLKLIYPRLEIGCNERIANSSEYITHKDLCDGIQRYLLNKQTPMIRLFIVMTLLLSFCNSCKKIDKLTQFNMEYNESIVIPSTTGIALPIDLLTPDIESNSESTFAINDTRKDLVEKIVLTSLDLAITSPSGGDFSFLESISIFINAEGLQETRIAWFDEIPPSAGSALVLETSDTDLKEYIKKDNFSLKVNTVTDELISSDHHIEIQAVFFVDAKILGI
jgi:hypothetical protein